MRAATPRPRVVTVRAAAAGKGRRARWGGEAGEARGKPQIGGRLPLLTPHTHTTHSPNKATPAATTLSGFDTGVSLGPNASPSAAVAARDRAGRAPSHPPSTDDLPRKTKIVCTIGPTSCTRESLFALADAGMNVARLNMSHGDHASHQAVVDLVKEYNALGRG